MQYREGHTKIIKIPLRLGGPTGFPLLEDGIGPQMYKKKEKKNDNNKTTIKK